LQSGIHPRTISCIEAHGTGTALGDPIEIKGLTDVYSRYTEDTGYCSISSVKSNIGHAEAAAGIAQLTKVLLQLKHRTLVRNVMHGSGLNPNIDFGRTPFVVQAETEAWKRPVIDGREMPRRAGISSFGAGGANAHVIIEEFTTASGENGTGVGAGNPSLILLSAKNEDRLTAQATQLLSAIRQQNWSDDVLPHMAYTLQVGRELMEERLGISVQTMQELEEKLDAFIHGRGQGKEYFRGQVKRNKEMISVIESDEEFQETIRKWIDRGKYSKVLDLWVKGLSIDWNLLYGDVKPSRMSLPTYPFAGEPYWVPEIETPSAPSVNSSLPSGQPAAVMHPLLHRNTSDMSGVRFSSTFTGREFFLADHVVMGNSVLPGVAYLEMALNALGQAVPEAQSEDGRPAVRLKNVVWARPITVMDTDTPVDVHIDLIQEEHGEFAFEVYTVQKRAEAEEEMILHSQGTAAVGNSMDHPVVDLQKFRIQCHPKPITATDIYTIYNEMGIQYGPGHQGIHEVWTGDGIVMADIRLPVQLTGTEAEFLLHPSLLDSALQATVTLILEPGQGAVDGMKAGLPFALQELEVFGRCPASVWAVIRYSEDHKHNSPVQRVNIDVCDEAGTVYVRIKGFSTRTAEAAAPSNALEENAGVLLFEPEWSECPVPMNVEVPSYASRLVFLCELGEVNTHALVNQPVHTRCIVLNQATGTMAERFMAYSEAVFSEIRSVLAQKTKDKVLIQVVMTTRAEHRYLAGLSGLLKAARSENSKLIGQVIELDNVDDSIFVPLSESSKCPADAHIRYADGKRWTAGWREIEPAASVDALPWKDHGVYMITGGAGALGMALVQEIISRVKEPSLILTGRSPISAQLESVLQDLRTTGANVIYKQADAADIEQITQLVHWIGEQYGTINGVIHAAGIIRDNLILNKGPAELQEVLLPKVAGLVHLDEASRDMPLDFLIAFSSVAGATGNPGQADYSAANAFMDAYSAYRSHLAAAGERHGRMLSINWPLWKDGGMRVDAEVEKIMLQSLGTVPMETGNGIHALYQGYAAGTEQVVVMAGVRSRIRARMSRSNPLPSAKDTGTSLQTGKDLSSYVQKVLLEGVSSLLKVKVEEIDVDSELSDYGFDSISLTQFANVLNERFQLELTPTLFFEYTTLSGFAEYLISEHPGAFAHRSESESGTVEVSGSPVHSTRETVIPTAKEPVQTALSTAWNPRRSRPAGPAARVEEQPAVPRDAYAVKQDPDPIAIVGISGIFPGAQDTHQFWSNIVEGMNGITEIPPDRWDWKEYAEASAENGGASSLKWGGFIERLKEFDPLFFGISPREAELMDPQQRLLLMQAWKAVEDAGMAASQLSQQPTGVFVAAGPGDYMSMTGIEQGNPQAMTGVVPSLIPNRISYALNLHGPSEYYETACSSMLVALHRAVRSLQSGECQQAIVGAVNLLISPAPFIGFDAMGYLSPEGCARSFQPEANGFVRSEGVGAVVLKPLSQAIADHHEIYAVIRGTGVSHGGKGMSLTSPNAHGMKTAIHQAFRQSGIDPRTISYIEGHGIASPMADGIEVNALKTGYREMAEAVSDVPWENPCYIGTLKPLIGHSEVASGLASLIKVIYALRHRLIPGISGFTAPSSHISLDGSPLRFSSEHLNWKVLTGDDGMEIPRRAAINSFGIGGVNGHILLEEYISPKGEPERERSADEAQLVVLSAKNKERLNAYARLLLQHVEQAEGLSLADMAYTLQVGREAMESRLALAADTREELILGLKVFLNDVAHQRNDKPYETIPIYTGNKGSLPKENQAHQAAAWIAGANLQQLAVYWVRGGKVEWEQLHQGKDRKRIPLPTYPFEPRICWPASLQTGSNEAQFAHISSLTQEATAAAAAAISEGKQVLELVSTILGLEPEEIHPDVPLDQYGLDSILLMQLLRQLQNDIDPGIDLYRLQECRSLKDIIQILPVSKPDALRNKPLRAASTPAAMPRSWPQFPELILLNKGLQGPPVFWFHGGLGGVEMYQELAFQSKRPFYGIQARGWMTEREPLQGIAAMAAYYSHMIQTVQPDGPYDLGGYSLGGVLAYEVTRQLQELGKTVKTLVMLDSPYGEAFQQGEISRPTAVLQAINLALASKNFQRPDAFADTLIHRDELDVTIDEERLLQQLIQLGYARGLTKTEKQIRAMIDANIKMQHAYQFDRFRVMPLPDASGVTCYYFRNKRGLIFGELEPYFSIGEDTAPLNQAAYWAEWERQFPQLHMIDIDPSNHMVLLSEPRSYETIFEFCSRLYSEEGMSDSELEDFKKNAMNAFGGK
jgi:polyketide synthase PksN